MMKALGVSGILLTSALVAGRAHADIVWTAMPGLQAREIAVGAEDTPWVVRNDGRVFYGGTTCSSTSPTICVQVFNWFYTHQSGNKIAVNLNSFPFMQDNAGHLFSWYVLGARWVGDPNLSYAGQGSGWCTNSFVATYADMTPELSLSTPTNTNVPWEIAKFWSLDCGASPGLWQLNADWVYDYDGRYDNWLSTTFQQIDTGDGTQLALFSTIAGPEISQTPWIVVRGHAWAWNGSSMVVTPYPSLFPGMYQYAVTAITDGYVLAGNSIWRWHGDVYGHPAGTIPWQFVAVAPSGVTLAKIAASSTFPSVNGPVGPSHIWALDTSGNVYRMDSSDGTVPR